MKNQKSNWTLSSTDTPHHVLTVKLFAQYLQLRLQLKIFFSIYFTTNGHANTINSVLAACMITLSVKESLETTSDFQLIHFKHSLFARCDSVILFLVKIDTNCHFQLISVVKLKKSVRLLIKSLRLSFALSLVPRMLEMGFQSFQIFKFSGGACPRPPQVKKPDGPLFICVHTVGYSYLTSCLLQILLKPLLVI